MSNFAHLDGMNALLTEIYEINERVMCGDIVSAKAAIASPRMQKLLMRYRDILRDDGATEIFLDPFVAAGGWVGITFSYRVNEAIINGSQVPRRV